MYKCFLITAATAARLNQSREMRLLIFYIVHFIKHTLTIRTYDNPGYEVGVIVVSVESYVIRLNPNAIIQNDQRFLD